MTPQAVVALNGLGLLRVGAVDDEADTATSADRSPVSSGTVPGVAGAIQPYASRGYRRGIPHQVGPEDPGRKSTIHFIHVSGGFCLLSSTDKPLALDTCRGTLGKLP